MDSSRWHTFLANHVIQRLISAGLLMCVIGDAATRLAGIG
jgi:hypothetical protein